jgi:ketosteroid isomerase-like protein
MEHGMAVTSQGYEEALQLFKRQIACVVDDEREAQMRLYAEDLRYEFPLANDRPRRIEGRDAFRRAMEPIWERRRKNRVELSLESYEFHATDEEGLFAAVFSLRAAIDRGEPVSSPCVQLIRVRGGRIAEVREYFEP